MEFAHHYSLFYSLKNRILLKYLRATLNAKTFIPLWNFAQWETFGEQIQFVANMVSKISSLMIWILSMWSLQQCSNLQYSSGVNWQDHITHLGNMSFFSDVLDLNSAYFLSKSLVTWQNRCILSILKGKVLIQRQTIQGKEGECASKAFK